MEKWLRTIVLAVLAFAVVGFLWFSRPRSSPPAVVDEDRCMVCFADDPTFEDLIHSALACEACLLRLKEVSAGMSQELLTQQLNRAFGAEPLDGSARIINVLAGQHGVGVKKLLQVYNEKNVFVSRDDLSELFNACVEQGRQFVSYVIVCQPAVDASLYLKAVQNIVRSENDYLVGLFLARVGSVPEIMRGDVYALLVNNAGFLNVGHQGIVEGLRAFWGLAPQEEAVRSVIAEITDGPELTAYLHNISNNIYDRDVLIVLSDKVAEIKDSNATSRFLKILSHHADEEDTWAREKLLSYLETENPVLMHSVVFRTIDIVPSPKEYQNLESIIEQSEDPNIRKLLIDLKEGWDVEVDENRL